MQQQKKGEILLQFLKILYRIIIDYMLDLVLVGVFKLLSFIFFVMVGSRELAIFTMSLGIKKSQTNKQTKNKNKTKQKNNQKNPKQPDTAKTSDTTIQK